MQDGMFVATKMERLLLLEFREALLGSQVIKAVADWAGAVFRSRELLQLKGNFLRLETVLLCPDGMIQAIGKQVRHLNPVVARGPTPGLMDEFLKSLVGAYHK